WFGRWALFIADVVAFRVVGERRNREQKVVAGWRRRWRRSARRHGCLSSSCSSTPGRGLTPWTTLRRAAGSWWAAGCDQWDKTLVGVAPVWAAVPRGCVGL